MAEAGDEAAALAKLQKKVTKLSKQHKAGSLDEDGIAKLAKLQKKLKKLQAADGASAAVSEPEAPKKEKRKQEAASAAVEEVMEAEEEVPKKKAKKVKHEAQMGSEGADGMALVGDRSNCSSGPSVVKALYKEHADVAGMTQEQVTALQTERCISLENCDAKPLTKFDYTGLPASMLHAIREFTTPSPIQAQCWPVVLGGRDLVGIAATGSGKTLAFGLPMLRHIVAQKEAGVVKGKGPFAVVMAPTRELALQINEVLQEAGSKCGINTVCIYGGVPKPPQVAACKKGVEVVVATPGRLEDLMNDGVCVLKQVTYVVLDEADRMLDLGFEPHIRSILATTRADRQTLMFSATWPSAVQKMASQFLANPAKVTIGSRDLAASHSITQRVEVLETHQRDARLAELLAQHHKSRKNRVIIFVLYKKEAPRVEQMLQRKGWTAASIHGDISQVQRTQAVESFKSGKVPLLIATDVAARGLDIPDVEVVINYSFPLTTEDYVHRIGRTGRAGKSGLAITFFCGSTDKPRAGELVNVLREAKQEVPNELLKFGTTVKKKESKLYGAHFKDVDFGAAKAVKKTFDSDDDE